MKRTGITSGFVLLFFLFLLMDTRTDWEREIC